MDIITVNDAVLISETEDEAVRARLVRLNCGRPLFERVRGEASEQLHKTWDDEDAWGNVQRAFLMAYGPNGRRPRTLMCMALRGLAQLDPRCRDVRPEALAEEPELVYVGLVQEFVHHPAKGIVLANSKDGIADLLKKRVAEAA